VQVEVGNNYGLPTASAMVVALAPTSADKIDFPDRLWRAVAAGSAVAPVLPEGITDASSRGRGAQGQAGDEAQRNSVPPAWSRGFNQPGWHGRGRTLRHVNGDYADLLSAAIEQGVALFDAARRVASPARRHPAGRASAPPVRRHRSARLVSNGTGVVKHRLPRRSIVPLLDTASKLCASAHKPRHQKAAARVWPGCFTICQRRRCFVRLML
jgi:hypothetical protein